MESQKRWIHNGGESWTVGSMGEVRPRPEGPDYPKGPNVSQETRDTGVAAKVGEAWLP